MFYNSSTVEVAPLNVITDDVTYHLVNNLKLTRLI